MPSGTPPLPASEANGKPIHEDGVGATLELSFPASDFAEVIPAGAFNAASICAAILARPPRHVDGPACALLSSPAGMPMQDPQN